MFFKTNTIYQYRKIPVVDNWGTPTLQAMTAWDVTIQPFTGDDHTLSNQWTQDARFLFTAPIGSDIKFGDIFVYNNSVYKVNYILPYDSGVLPHMEVYLSDSQEEVPVWPL